MSGAAPDGAMTTGRKLVHEWYDSYGKLWDWGNTGEESFDDLAQRINAAVASVMEEAARCADAEMEANERIRQALDPEDVFGAALARAGKLAAQRVAAKLRTLARERAGGGGLEIA